MKVRYVIETELPEYERRKPGTARAHLERILNVFTPGAVTILSEEREAVEAFYAPALQDPVEVEEFPPLALVAEGS